MDHACLVGILLFVGILEGVGMRLALGIPVAGCSPFLPPAAVAEVAAVIARCCGDNTSAPCLVLGVVVAFWPVGVVFPETGVELLFPETGVELLGFPAETGVLLLELLLGFLDTGVVLLGGVEPMPADLGGVNPLEREADLPVDALARDLGGVTPLERDLVCPVAAVVVVVVVAAVVLLCPFAGGSLWRPAEVKVERPGPFCNIIPLIASLVRPVAK